MVCVVRRGTQEDLVVIQRLNSALFVYESDRGLYHDDSYDLEWPFSEAGTKYFQDGLGENPQSVVFVARDASEAVGYLAAGYRSYPYRSANPIAELENMFVVESHRGQGVGTQLVDAFKSWANEAQAARLRVGAFIGNVPAVDFYRKHGFVDDELFLEMKVSGE